MKNKLRVVLYFGPSGFSGGNEIMVRFTNKKRYPGVGDPPLLALTHGEGTALQFVLEDSDCGTGFYNAIYKSNHFLEAATDWKKGHFEMRYVPAGKHIKIVDSQNTDTRLQLARAVIEVLSHNGLMPENLMTDKGEAWRKWTEEMKK